MLHLHRSFTITVERIQTDHWLATILGAQSPLNTGMHMQETFMKEGEGV